MNELPMYKFFYEMFMHLSFFLTVAKGLPDSMQLQQNKRQIYTYSMDSYVQ